MSKVKPSEKLIPKIHRRNYSDLSMFFFVWGQKSIMPAISIEKAMYNYFVAVGENDFNVECSLTTYARMQKEFNENAKENN
jgi:hypothetical protein